MNHPTQNKTTYIRCLRPASLLCLNIVTGLSFATELQLAQSPISISQHTQPPLTMLIMSRDHTLFFEAYTSFAVY